MSRGYRFSLSQCCCCCDTEFVLYCVNANNVNDYVYDFYINGNFIANIDYAVYGPGPSGGQCDIPVSCFPGMFVTFNGSNVLPSNTAFFLGYGALHPNNTTVFGSGAGVYSKCESYFNPDLGPITEPDTLVFTYPRPNSFGSPFVVGTNELEIVRTANQPADCDFGELAGIYIGDVCKNPSGFWDYTYIPHQECFRNYNIRRVNPLTGVESEPTLNGADTLFYIPGPETSGIGGRYILRFDMPAE